MSNFNVKVGDVQKEVVQGWAKIDGVWKEIQSAYGKVDNDWKESWQNAFDRPEYINHVTSATREDTIQVEIAEVDGAHYEVMYRYARSGAWQDDLFTTSNTFNFTITNDISASDLQFRVRAVDPNGNPNRSSSWLQGRNISLSPAKLARPTGLSYPSTIVRGENNTIRWNREPNVTMQLQSVYERDNGEVVIFNRTSSDTASSHTHVVSSRVEDRNRIRYRIRAIRTGYLTSDWQYGPWRNLTNQTLGRTGAMSSVTPYEGQRITTSWGSAANATRYQLEFQINGGSWDRIYWGSNRSYSQTITARAGQTLRWRVRPTAPDFFSGDWRYSSTRTVQLPPIKTRTWTATSVESWRDSFGWRTPGSGYAMGGEWMMQGEWDIGGGLWGNHKGLAYFNFSDMRNELSGKRIESVELYLYRMARRHGYYSPQPVTLFTHNYTRAGRPNGEPTINYVQGPFSSFGLGEGKWIRVNNTVINRIINGSARGIAVYRAQRNHYIYFSQNVRIRVRYR